MTEKSLYGIQQLRKLEWFAQIRLRAYLVGLVSSIPISGKKDDRNGRRQLALPERPCEAGTIHLRHRPVQQNEPGSIPIQVSKGLQTVMGTKDTVAFRLEGHGERLVHPLIVIHDQNRVILLELSTHTVTVNPDS